MNWLLFLGLCLLVGCATSSMHGGKSPSQIRVTTFNIRFGTADDGPNHWDLRQDALIKAIRGFDPDILGTQECLAAQRDVIIAKLPHYAAIAVGRDDGREAGEMTATFYRRDRFELLDSGHFWLSETPAVPGSKSWDSSMTRMATWLKLRDRLDSSRPILVINTHFDHVGVQARLESARLIRRRAMELGQGCSIVVLGDFNCGEDDAPYAALIDDSQSASPLNDAYRTMHRRPQGNEATFHAFKPRAARGKRIDWILVSPDFSVSDARIDRATYDGRLPSDHFAIHAILQRTGLNSD